MLNLIAVVLSKEELIEEVDMNFVVTTDTDFDRLTFQQWLRNSGLALIETEDGPQVKVEMVEDDNVINFNYQGARFGHCMRKPVKAYISRYFGMVFGYERHPRFFQYMEEWMERITHGFNWRRAGDDYRRNKWAAKFSKFGACMEREYNEWTHERRLNDGN